MSLPEVLLWERLRQRPEGVKFRRQHPVGRFVIDFYCPAARLAIEVDGEAHNRGARPERDLERDIFLRVQGLRLVRIAARDVLEDVDAVADALVAAALPLHRPAGGPPPQPLRGEDLVGATA